MTTITPATFHVLAKPMFDAALASWVGAPPAVCVFSETCGDAVALEHKCPKSRFNESLQRGVRRRSTRNK